MVYSDSTQAEKNAVEQIARDMRAWAGTFQRLLNDGKQLRLAYDQTLVPIANTRVWQGADVVPSATLPGSDPNWTYSNLITLASYMDADTVSLTGSTGGDWDEAAKSAAYVQAAGPLT